MPVERLHILSSILKNELIDIPESAELHNT